MTGIETMAGVDILTRDIADMRNGLEFVNHTPRHVSPCAYPISGDEIARIWAEHPSRKRILAGPRNRHPLTASTGGGDGGGTDCGA